MRSYDYYVKFDPDKDTNLTLFMKILYAVILKPIKFKKPRITHISGKSGEGKSLTALYIMYLLLKMQDLDIKKYLEAINISKQDEYPKKLKAILNSDMLKDVNVLAIHEGREAMEANEWRSIFNRNVAHVNALSRAIKRLAIFIISQGIKDITKDVRRTLDYQIKIVRPLRYGIEGNARIFWYVIYEDDRDIENVILRKRKLKGILIMPDGSHVIHQPSYISIPKVDKEVEEIFNIMDKKSKWEILNKRLEEMEQDMNRSNADNNKKVDDLVAFYARNEMSRENLMKINSKNCYKVTKEFKLIHDLKESEITEFEKKLKQMLEVKNETITKF
jgi:hypothetical protein